MKSSSCAGPPEKRVGDLCSSKREAANIPSKLREKKKKTKQSESSSRILFCFLIDEVCGNVHITKVGREDC